MIRLMVRKLELVPLRTIWTHEAGDFTSWLFDNIDILNEQLGLELIPVEKEKPVGSFTELAIPNPRHCLP
jgi:hypothetical protein